MHVSFRAIAFASFAAFASSSFVFALAVRAQDAYPSRPVKFVIGYPPGGLPDTMARVVSQRLAESMSQQFIVDNRPGAGGIVATESVIKAAPDGYTLLVADGGQTSINMALYPKLSYDTLRDLAPITRLGTSPFFLAVHASTGVTSFSELVTQIRAKPGQLAYGSSGNGSPHHLAMEMLKSKLNLEITHVPYKGSGQSTPAFIGGQIPQIFTVLPSVAAHVRTGTVRLLAVASATRTNQAPGIPTFAELGVPDMLFLPTISVLAPIGTPAAIVGRLAAELGKAINHPDSIQRFATLGIDPVSDSPSAYAAMLKADIAYYANAVRVSGAKAD